MQEQPPPLHLYVPLQAAWHRNRRRKVDGSQPTFYILNTYYPHSQLPHAMQRVQQLLRDCSHPRTQAQAQQLRVARIVQPYCRKYACEHCRSVSKKACQRAQFSDGSISAVCVRCASNPQLCPHCDNKDAEFLAGEPEAADAQGTAETGAEAGVRVLAPPVEDPVEEQEQEQESAAPVEEEEVESQALWSTVHGQQAGCRGRSRKGRRRRRRSRPQSPLSDVSAVSTEEGVPRRVQPRRKCAPVSFAVPPSEGEEEELKVSPSGSAQVPSLPMAPSCVSSTPSTPTACGGCPSSDEEEDWALGSSLLVSSGARSPCTPSPSLSSASPTTLDCTRHSTSLEWNLLDESTLLLPPDEDPTPPQPLSWSLHHKRLASLRDQVQQECLAEDEDHSHVPQKRKCLMPSFPVPAPSTPEAGISSFVHHHPVDPISPSLIFTEDQWWWW